MSEMSLTSLFETFWKHLERGSADRTHPARHPTLATIGPEGPELRTLVLRQVSRDSATLVFHTDVLSPKVAQIGRDPRVSLHVWLPEAHLQLRMRARASVAPGDPALFARLPEAAQQNYRGAVPGGPPDAQPPHEGPARFAAIACVLTEVDILHLGTIHRRALYRAPDWHGVWIAP